MLEYNVEYVKSEDLTDKQQLGGYDRPIYFTDKLDETLDSGVLVWQNDELLDLEPSARILINVTDADEKTAESLEFVVSDIQAEITRAS